MPIYVNIPPGTSASYVNSLSRTYVNLLSNSYFNIPSAEAMPPGNPLVWFDGQNLDLSFNATLVNNQNLTIVKNRGSLGSAQDAVPVGTAPKFKLASGFGTILFAGGDRMATPAFAAAPAQPNTIAIVVKQTSGATNVFCDGTTAGGRQQVFDNAFASLYAGSVLGCASGTTVNKFSPIVAVFNGASSIVRLNMPIVAGNDLANGAGGANVPAGVTIGGEFGGANTMIGEMGQYLLYGSGTAPSTDLIEDWLDAKYNVGWPKSSLTHLVFSTSPTPNITVNSGEKVCFFGDSITATYQWYDGLVTSINAIANPDITVVNAGVNNDTFANLDARVIADVVNLVPQPTVVYIECGINDFFTRVPLDTMVTNAQSVITKLKAGIVGVKIAMLGPMTRQETYPDPQNARIYQYASAIQGLCVTNGLTYIDVRTPQQTYEAANNTPPPGNPFSPGPLGQTLLTLDGVHPNATGKALWSSTAFGRTTVVP